MHIYPQLIASWALCNEDYYQGEPHEDHCAGMTQVQQKGMQALCCAYRTLEIAAAIQMLGLEQPAKSAQVLEQLIALLQAVATSGNVQAQRALSQWQMTGAAHLRFRA